MFREQSRGRCGRGGAGVASEASGAGLPPAGPAGALWLSPWLLSGSGQAALPAGPVSSSGKGA